MNVSRIAQRHVGYRWLDVGRHRRKRIDSNDSRRPRQRDQPDRHGAGLRFWGFRRIVGKAIEERGHRKRFSSRPKLDSSGTTLCFAETPRRVASGRRSKIRFRRLRTDYIDIYQVHWPDSAIPIEETARTMQALFKEGLIRAIGVAIIHRSR